MPTYEVGQATGAHTRIIYCKETDWGVAPSTGYKTLNVVGGESLDDQISTYRSNVIRSDRMKNPTVRGTRRPGGTLPFELAPRGVSQLLWHALGGSVWTTAYNGTPANQIQTVTITGAPTGGTFKLTFAGYTTGPIAYNAAAAVVQTALQGLASIGTDNATVTGSAGGPYAVTFAGNLAEINVEAMTADATGLTGGSTPGVTVEITTPAVTNDCKTGHYKHVIRGSTTLPIGFTIEKGFLDLATPAYYKMTGCRVSRLAINANIDAMVTGSVDLMSREMTQAATSVCTGTLADAPVVGAFTAVEAAIYKDGSQISVVQNLGLTLDNGMNDNTFALGSVYRQNLKPGSRTVEGTAQFLFQDTTFYDAAMAGTNLAMKVLCTHGDESIEFYMPVVQLLPNNSSPKIENDGPLSISTNWEAVKDVTRGTDIQITVISTEATIDY